MPRAISTQLSELTLCRPSLPPPPCCSLQVPDVVGYLIKAIVDTKYTALLLTTWVGLVVSWAVMRLYIYPVYIVSHSLHGLEVLWDVEGA